MNSHHPFKPKRPRPHPGVEDPLPSSLSLNPPAELGYNSLPIDIRLQLDQLAHFYGISSGVQIHQNIQQDQSRKRRRLDQHFPMDQERGSSSSQGSLEKFPAPVPYDQRQQGQYGPTSSWAESGSSPMPSPGSPLAKRMADLSLLLCPCCGFGLRPLDGYQQLPEAPPVVQGPVSPYMAEKPPSMQIPVSEPYGSANLDLTQQTTFPYAQTGLTSPPLTGFPLIPDQPTLTVPLINGTNSGQHHGLPVADYYASHTLKPDPDLQNQSVLQPDPIVPQDMSAIQYGSDLGLVVGQEMTQQAMETAANMSQYGLVPAGQLDEALSQAVPVNGWSDVALLDQHANFDILLPNQRGGKRGPFRDLNLREQTAQTRKIGSCIRCRMQRIRCENNDEEGGPCLTCKKVSNSRAGRFPCLRYKITDIRLFKPGQVPGFEWTRRWNNNISDPIQNWASEDLKTIFISDGLSNRFVEVQVRRFIPQAGDKLERTWDFKGMKKSVSIPPYALVKLEDVKKAYSEHIQESMREAFGSLLGRPESLLYQTYDRAWRIFRDPSTPMECLDLIGRTLMLWMSIRLTTRSSFIVGTETLGMPRDILDETSPNHGMIPLPPVLGAQLDLVLIHHIQTRLRRELLDRLQKTIQKNKQSTWLVTYLVTFILLHNTALITGHDAGYARKHGMKRRFAREDKVKEYHLGANILLAHFHYCNKGIYPFSEGCKDQDLRTLAGLDEEKIQFVHATRANAKQNKREWEELRDGATYEDDYFFVSQLFEENWQPRTTL